jgi:HD superfamily phosphohydrolase
MELASKIFDVITDPRHVHQRIRSLIPEISLPAEGLGYWRRVLRMAALCHDIGHLPFSHATEKLLPKGWNHENISVEIIMSDEMREIWGNMTPPLHAEHIA